MRTSSLLVAMAVVGGSVYMARGCLSRPAPEDRLVSRFDDLCTIAKRNINTPEQGVKAFGTYLGKYLGDMTGDFGDLIVATNKAKDPDAAAHAAHDKLEATLEACGPTIEEFAKAVEANGPAREYINTKGDRAVRTILILLTGSANGQLIPTELTGAIQRLERSAQSQPQH
ncbi:MAG: hypothetical protein QM831_15710 [Kofleriaceae bacterium]